MYGLDPATTLPPPIVASLPDGFPPLAPHLLDCSLEAAKAEAAETLGDNGEVPEWWGEGGSPDPPWVRGGREDNLPLTRNAQADIWRHQHPVNCSDTGVRFFYIAWSPTRGYGLGSQLHLMTSAMSLAISHGRILVVAPATFTRADHEGCKGKARRSLECYFKSLTKAECGVRVAEILEGTGVTFVKQGTDEGERSRALASATTLVVYQILSDKRLESEAGL